jgi:hypothetical protein
LFTATSELLWLTDARIADDHSFIEHALTWHWGETAILFAHAVVRAALLDMTGVRRTGQVHCCRRAAPRLETQVDVLHSIDVDQVTASIVVVAKSGRTIVRVTDWQFVNAKHIAISHDRTLVAVDFPDGPTRVFWLRIADSVKRISSASSLGHKQPNPQSPA